jgi:hypothetical protein
MVGSPLERLRNSVYGFGLTTDKDIAGQQKSKTAPTSKTDKTDVRKSADKADVRRSEERIAAKPEALAQAGLTPEEMARGSTRAGTFEAMMNRDTTSGTAIPKEMTPPNKYDTFMEEIAAQRENLAAQRGEDRNMALLAAGLGMMGGTSPYAFANVGQGGLSGMQYLSEANKARAAEKAALDKNQMTAMRYRDLGDIAAGDKANTLAIRKGELAVKEGALGEKELQRIENSMSKIEARAQGTAKLFLTTNPIAGLDAENPAHIQLMADKLLGDNQRYKNLYRKIEGVDYSVPEMQGAVKLDKKQQTLLDKYKLS